MNRLMAAIKFNLAKDTLFWASLPTSFATGILFGYCSLSNNYFDDVAVLVLLMTWSICLSFFIGKEYSGGVIRNKVISGHTRTNIFFSKLLMSWCYTAATLSLFFLPFVIVTYQTMLSYTPLAVLLQVLGYCYLAGLSFGAIITTVSCSFSSKAVASIINICLLLGLMATNYEVQSLLYQSEFISVTLVGEDGLPETIKYFENSSYIHSEFIRTVLSTVDYLNPYNIFSTTTSLLSQFISSDFTYISTDTWYTRLPYIPGYSVICTVAISTLGLIVFRIKEFK